MSVPTTTARNAYTGDGTTTVFAYTFPIDVAADLVAYADDVVVTNYTLSGLGLPGGGNVTFSPAPASGVKLVFLRAQVLTQTLDPNVQTFGLAAITAGLDKAVKQAQMLAERIGRALKLAPSATQTDLTIPAPESGKAVRWKADLSGLENYTATAGSVLGTPVAIADGGTSATTVAAALAALDTQKWKKGADIVAASALPLGADGNYFAVTGNTQIDTITAFAGPLIILRFTGTPTVVHSASIVLAGAANFVAAAGDILILTHEGAGVYREANRFLATPSAAASNLPPKYRSGGVLSNAADTVNDITIAAGAWRADDDAEDLRLVAAITKRLDATWAVGTNQGGLDTGVVADDVYFLWAIKRVDTGVVDVLFSASATAPTMPANYTKKRRLRGAAVRVAGSLLLFDMNGAGEILWKDPPLDHAAVTSGTSATLKALTVPDQIRVTAGFKASISHATLVRRIYFSCPAVTDEAADFDAAPLASLSTRDGGGVNVGEMWERTNVSAQIREVSDGASAVLYLSTKGFRDNVEDD